MYRSLWSLLLLGLGACAGPLNEQIDLVGRAPMPALSAAGQTSLPSPVPSLRGLDRGHWPQVVVRIPTRQVAHQPNYVGLGGFGTPPDPGGSAFPGAVEALQKRPTGAVDLCRNTGGVVSSAVRMVLIPVQMAAGRGPWRSERSPALPYERVNRSAPDRISRWNAGDPPAPPPTRPPQEGH